MVTPNSTDSVHAWHESCDTMSLRGHRMWFQIGAAAGVVVVVFALFKRISRPKSKEIDVGAVSDAWLAEHRARGRDSV